MFGKITVCLHYIIYTLPKLLISFLDFQVLSLFQQDEFRNKKKDRLIPTNLYSRAYSSSYSCSDLLDNAPLNAVANDSHVYNSAQWQEFQNVVQKYTMADVSYTQYRNIRNGTQETILKFWKI